MPKQSAGLLFYRDKHGMREVFLVHPGGPLWARRDDASWSIPKGEIHEGEEPLDAAKREFREETGFEPDGQPIPLKPLRQASGKIVHAWAMKGDVDAAKLRSNTFQMEWPPRSGRQRDFPEVDRGAWFSLEKALVKILPGQSGFITEVADAARFD